MSFCDAPAPDPSPTVTSEIKRRCPNVFLVILRQKNANVVVYEARVKSPGVFDREKPFDVYWLDIDPAYRATRRAQGIKHDRVELSAFEFNRIFGITWQLISDSEAHVKFNVEDWPVRVKLSAMGAKLFAQHGENCFFVHRGFVSANDRTPNLTDLKSNVVELSFTGVLQKTNQLVNVEIVRNGERVGWRVSTPSIKN